MDAFSLYTWYLPLSVVSIWMLRPDLYALNRVKAIGWRLLATESKNLALGGVRDHKSLDGDHRSSGDGCDPESVK